METVKIKKVNSPYLDRNTIEVMEKLSGVEMLKPGDGATIHYGSDAYPYTITKVYKDLKHLEIQEDDYKRTDKNGMSENQEYDYIPNPNGKVYKLRLNKNNNWVTTPGGERVYTGGRRRYYDYSF